MQPLLKVEPHHSPVILRERGTGNVDTTKRKSGTVYCRYNTSAYILVHVLEYTYIYIYAHIHIIAPPRVAEKPPPPKVAEKPKVGEKPLPQKMPEETDEANPETLSFREKLALHKKAVDDRVDVPRLPVRPQSAREYSRELQSPPRDAATKRTSLTLSVSSQGN